MKILSKINDFIDIKISTYLLLLITFLSGQFKNILIFLILSGIHELGHLIVCLFFKVKVKKITILPFGFNLKIDDISYLKSYKVCIIYLFGPLMFILNLFLIKFLYVHNIISYTTYMFSKNANIAINVFNLLPIYPLDGYHIINSIMQYALTYKKTLILSVVLSIIFFIGLLIYNIYNPQIVITIFLFFMQIMYLKEIPMLYKRFLIEKTYQKKHKNFKIINNYDMYKEKNNYKIEKNAVLDDKKIALRLLSKNK